MSKTFNYCIEVGCSRYSEQTDEEFCDTVDYDYNVSNDEIEEALGVIIFNEEIGANIKLDANQKKMLKNNLSKFLKDNDLIDELSDIYEDSLKDYFEEKAIESYRG